MRQLLVVLCVIHFCSSMLFGADYRFVRFDVPGAVATFALGVNARRDIVGRYIDADGKTHGFLLHKGLFTNIDPPRSTFTAARGINARGDIVGRTITPSGEHGFLFRDGKFTLIDFPGASATSARGINNAGEITGRHFDSNSNESGFVLRGSTFYNVHVPQSLTPLGVNSTDVWMLMDNGKVAIGDFGTNADGGVHAFIRTKTFAFQIIDFPRAGAPCSAPRWINERGDIVGVYANTLDECFNFQAHGFSLKNGTFKAIDFPNSSFTEVFGINDDGLIVGDYTDKNGVVHGFSAVPSTP